MSRNVPAVSSLVAFVVCLTLAAVVAVGVFTQPDREPTGRRIDGLVLDGGPTTTGPGSLPGPVEPIPQRTIEGAEK